VREPTGAPSLIKCSTKALNRDRLRSDNCDDSVAETILN
jgi:hypothetical protein